MPKAAPRVLLVDDSSSVRAALSKALTAQGFEVVGGAADAYHARDLIFALKPDVVTLDLQMPSLDGLSFLAKLMAFHPLPVLVLSALTESDHGLALRAIELGAVEVFPKPSGWDLPREMERLGQALRRVAQSRPRRANTGTLPLRADWALDAGRVIAIGASTGGTAALTEILSALPANSPPLLMVQHMPVGFTSSFARRLDQCSPLNVREARDGELLRSGCAYLAPAGSHLRLLGRPGAWRLSCAPGPAVQHVVPSVDVLFHSVAEVAGSQALGVLLTGMGRDGAEGLLHMRQNGAHTLAQDQASSVVWGMPGEAHRIGAAQSLLPLHEIPAHLLGLLRLAQTA